MKTTLLNLFAAFSLTLLLASCSNQQSAKETEGTKTTAADIYKSQLPEYDSKNINPDAPVSHVNLKATGNTMAEITYDQKKITVKQGTTVHLTFTNTSTDAAMPHNWVLIHDGTGEKVAAGGATVGKEGSFVPDLPEVLIATRLLGPNETTEIIFPAPPSGKYQFICTYPGHWTVMNGKFIVE